MTFYRDILKQALVSTWNNKHLWWFGIFAAFLGSGGEMKILLNNAGGDPGRLLFPAWQNLASTGVFSRQTFTNIGFLFTHDTLNMVVFLIMALAILAATLLLIWLVVVSQAALVSGSAALINKKQLSFKDGLNAGILNFWPVLILNIIVKAAVYILFLAVSIPLIFFRASFVAALFYAFALALAALAALILSFIVKYAIAYAVVYKQKVGSALKKAWRLFKNNWLISLEMAVILFVIDILIGLAIFLAILTLAVPFLFLGLIFFYSFSAVGSWLIVVLALVCFLFIVVAGGAALSVFQISSWTALFLELDKKRGVSKLVRAVSSLIH
ncbi:MAG: hypothetical protein PHS62_02330 [Patescibacteria group bacterium]|nr:hypothetical protein [Patescibacteria group bacterium]